MKSTLPFVGLAVAATLASAVPPPTTTEDALDLSTRYTEGLRLRLDAELTYESERTAFEMIRDGEPVDFGDRMMGGPSLLTRWTSSVYGVEAVEDGAPVDVRLGFERLEQETFAIRRDEEVVDTTNSPLEEVVLGLTLEDGEVVAEVLEGSEPDDEALLEGFSMDLGLDALLPEGPVEPGAEWDVEGAALVRALSFDLEAQLFPPSPRPELGAEGGGRGGRGGFRGMRGGGGGNLGTLLRDGEWDLEATLGAEPEEAAGRSCWVITVTGDAEVELPERQFGGGGGRGGGGGGALLPLPAPLTRANLGTVEVEALLYVSTELGHPVLLEVELTTVVESESEREGRDGSTMQTSSTTEGTMQLVVEVAEAAEDDE